MEILQHYSPLLAVDEQHISQIGMSVKIPEFSAVEMTQLCHSAIQILAHEPTLLSLSGDIYIVGDLHGNLFDLLRILKVTGLPPATKILFLGDYVDRGDYSIEVITLLLALLVVFPENIFLLRGNHEVCITNIQYGFKDSCNLVYPGNPSIYESFNEVFSYLPIGAVIENSYLCIHGGLCPGFWNLKQLLQLKRPIVDITGTLAEGILWSDPSEHINSFGPNLRGTGTLFGRIATEQFLKTNSLNGIIRSHEFTKDGIHITYNRKLVTLFSTSNYTYNLHNKSGILHCHGDLSLEKIILDEYEHIRRDSARFYTVDQSGIIVKSFSRRLNTIPSPSKVQKHSTARSGFPKLLPHLKPPHLSSRV